METWRLLELSVNDAYMNMALDEAVMRAVSQGMSPNTVRFYRWRPSAVSIGYFQAVRRVVNLEACRRYGVDVVRRITGGGAVYHDQDGELTYSLIASEDSQAIPDDIMESYRLICGGIVSGLRMLGVEAEFKPVNDVAVRGRKVSGSAQTRRMGVVLQHGTVLLDVDVEKMFTVLRVPKEKIRDKLISDIKQRVTSLTMELGRKPGFREVAEALKEGFEEELGVELEPGTLTEWEASEAERLAREKYSTEWWTFRR